MNKYLRYLLTFSIIILLIFSVSCVKKPSDESFSNATDMEITDTKTSELIEGYPKPIGCVNDFAEIFEKEYIDKMETLITDLEKETTAEIAVVTTDSLEGKSIEMYAVELFEAWGIGKADKDNGILFLVALKDREYRIEVGYGLENVITDVIASDILDEIVLPKFKEVKYGLGSFECVQKISEYIMSANLVEKTQVQEQEE